MERFSFNSIFHSYSRKDIVGDAMIPFFLATALCILVGVTGNDVLSQIKKLVALGLNVLPEMVALLFAAYAIVVTFFSDSVFQKAKDKEKGKELINTLNSSFCIYLLVSVIGIVIMVITSLIVEMEIEVSFHRYINYGIYWIISFLMFYSIITLFGIIMDIYYCSKATVGDEQSS